MDLQANVETPARSRAMAAAWVVLPVVVALYVFFRYAASGQASQLAGQIVYLVPPILAAAFSCAAAWLASSGSRAKLIWSLLAVATTLMFVSEAYFSWAYLTAAAPSLRDTVFDAINALAFVALLAMLLAGLALDRIGWRRILGTLLDSIAIATVCVIALGRAWVWVGVDAIDSMQAMRMAAYSLAGITLLLLDVGLAIRTPKPQWKQQWVVLTLTAVAVYSVALILWPWWNLAFIDLGSWRTLEAAIAILFLLGYYLVFLAGLARVIHAADPWTRVTAVEPVHRSAWPAVVVSGSVLLSVIGLGWAAFESRGTSPEHWIYLVGLVITTVCMVGRTALAAFESDSARSLMALDRVSGALNPREFDARLAGAVSLARRFGDRSALFIVDLDDPRAPNETTVRGLPDEVLRRVAGALRTSGPPQAGIYRLSGDAFAVLSPVSDRDQATAMAPRILAAVRSAGSGDIDLSVSVGFAVSPDDAVTAETLIKYADVAVAWAKQQGDGRYAAFDHRVATAVGTHELSEGSSLDDVGNDVARALVAASDARDPVNFRHSRGVAALACLLAEALPGNTVDIERLRLAAMLHDVGMIGLPSPTGPAGIRPIDTLAARAHCELGAAMLSAAHLDDIASWVLHHHERWDGSGYPGGLGGELIPLESRIIALADAYIALTSPRTGEPLTRAAALQEIDRGIASHFDPLLADHFIRTVGSTQALGWSDQWPAA